ncbi:hypothetical protein ElyMa_002062700 [Elysia marginata]|uniref:Uncharacterized protein n=1 Tax=Elysia marginata TaxID=1093978 RepID=A0AAV4F9Z8_9GAST|nr:hypothetical protein ElyMa_002062700 [Elysia marginata]
MAISKLDIAVTIINGRTCPPGAVIYNMFHGRSLWLASYWWKLLINGTAGVAPRHGVHEPFDRYNNIIITLIIISSIVIIIILIITSTIIIIIIYMVSRSSGR